MSWYVPLGLVLVATACGAAPPTAPDAMVVDPPPTSGAPPTGTRVARGAFQGAGRYTARGEVTLTVSGTAAVLDLSANFLASGVPDPVLYVGSSADPNFGTALRIGRYASMGGQRFAFTLPSGPLPQFVMLWCDRFNAPVGYAMLN